VDSPEFRFIETYTRKQNPLSKQTFPLTIAASSTTNNTIETRTCSNCKQILIDNHDTLINRSNAQQPLKHAKVTNLLMNNRMNIFNKFRKQIAKNNNNKLINLKHKKNCIFVDEQSQMNNQSKDTLSIDSPMKFDSVNKLSQVTITAASENCKLLVWKRDRLVNDTLANNLRLRVIFDNLIGKFVFCLNHYHHN
jgi:hypothetical protein